MADSGNRGRTGNPCAILPLIEEVLHYNTPPPPKRPKQKKRNTQTEGKKSGLVGEGLVREIRKQNDGHTTGDGFIAYHYVPLFPLFPAHSYHWTTQCFPHGFFHLALKTIWVHGRYYGTVVTILTWRKKHSTPPG